MRWLEQELGDWEREEGKRRGIHSLDVMNEEAESVSAGSDGVVFLPYMSGERSPIWDPDAKGVYYGRDFGKTKGHLIRAAMEGTAYALRHNLEAAERSRCESRSIKSNGWCCKLEIVDTDQGGCDWKKNRGSIIGYSDNTWSCTSCRSWCWSL